MVLLPYKVFKYVLDKHDLFKNYKKYDENNNINVTVLKPLL